MICATICVLLTGLPPSDGAGSTSGQAARNGRASMESAGIWYLPRAGCLFHFYGLDVMVCASASRRQARPASPAPFSPNRQPQGIRVQSGEVATAGHRLAALQARSRVYTQDPRKAEVAV